MDVLDVLISYHNTEGAASQRHMWFASSAEAWLIPCVQGAV